MLSERALSRLRDLYDRKVMNNVFRAQYIECLVVEVLGKDWKLTWERGHDWAPWDIESLSGDYRIEIKHSAARQTWHDSNSKPAKPNFDIRFRKGYWTKESKWVEETGRHASIYVFAWHGEMDEGKADHREPAQWEFYVVPTEELPDQKSIGLRALQESWRPIGFEAVADTVNELCGSSDAE